MLVTNQNPIKQQKGTSHKIEQLLEEMQTQPTVAEALVQMLQDLGVCHAFGVSGGAIAPTWEALEKSSIELLHFRHEAGAAFAATEAYFVVNRPIVVFATTGPGITNVLTGIFAARSEGAKVILVSGATPASLQGKGALQETSQHTMPEELFKAGMLFDYAISMKSADDLSEIADNLALGLNKIGSFVAHINIPTNIQTTHIDNNITANKHVELSLPGLDAKTIEETAKLLASDPFAIWVGFGSRGAAPEILELAHKTGALVMSSPRGKGIFPEDHPQYLGVTGFAGHQSVLEYMQSTPPERILVLGSRLGEFTSFWNPLMVPPKGFIHVDINPRIPGAAYPGVETLAICADIKIYLLELLNQLPQKMNWSAAIKMMPNSHEENIPHQGLVRPQVLMKAIQKIVIEGFEESVILAEGGNSFAWATHYLRFDRPNRWRISTGFASMGHVTTGVVGAAISGNKAVGIAGDGAMLMNNEINTAVHYNIPAVWIILNDSKYNMCAQGMRKLGYKYAKTEIPSTDFVLFARSLGADGICVEKESEIEAALLKAMTAKTPFVVDVRIDSTEQAPIGKRVSSLIEQKEK